MAQETTQSVWSNAKGMQIAEVLGTVPLPANLPKITLLPLINQDSIVGQPTEKKRYPVFSDLGVASSATENTDIAANVELAMGTAVDVTVGENAAVKSVITDRALERLFPGRSGIPQLIQAQDPELLIAALGPQAQRHMAMCVEKAESDAKDLLSGLSNTEGGGAGVDLRVSDLFAADYRYKTLDPHSEDTVFFLWPHQIRELQSDLALNGGGLGASVWSAADASAIMSMNPDMPRNGLRGSFLGRPVYEGAHSLREESGNAAYGAVFARGRGAPDQIGASVSPFVYLEGRNGFTHYVQLSAAGRSIELVTVLVYAVAEIKDNAGVAIVSDDA
jgi:hypothetical protein